MAAGVGGQVTFGGKYTAAGAITEWSAIQGSKSTASDDYSGQIEFKTRKQAYALQTKMTLTSDGNLGIGTANPSRLQYGSVDPKLHVDQGWVTGSYNLTARFSAGGDENNTGASILINHSNDRGLLIEAGREIGDTGIAHFGIVTAGGTNTRLMTLKQGGNVGIGTTDPDQPLHVVGTRPIRIQRSGVGEFEIMVDNTVTGDSSDFVIEPVSGTNSAGFQVRTRDTAGSLIEALNVNHDGNVGIGTDSPQVPLDIMPDSSKRVFGSQQNGTQHGFCEYIISGTIGANAVTITMQCPSYFQSEVVATFQQSNGGSDNNVYFNGIWSNNHTTHLFKNKTDGGTVPRIGSLGSATPAFTVGQGDAAVNSGKLVFTKPAATGTSGTYCIRVIAYGYSSKYMTYVVS
jgi:hypothetical protein